VTTAAAADPVIPVTTPVDIPPVRQHASASLRHLAAELARTHQPLGVHQHLADAADQVRIGNDTGALRHLHAAVFALQPGMLHRAGIHDDDGHAAAQRAVHGIIRHQLLVRNIQDAEARNLAAITRDSYGAAPVPPHEQAGDGSVNAPARVPAGRVDPHVADPGSVAQFARTWDEVCKVIELGVVRPYRRTVMTKNGPVEQVVRGYVDRRPTSVPQPAPARVPTQTRAVLKAAQRRQGRIPEPKWAAGEREWVQRGEAAWAARRKAAEAREDARQVFQPQAGADTDDTPEPATAPAVTAPAPAVKPDTGDGRKVLGALQQQGVMSDEEHVRQILRNAIHPPADISLSPHQMETATHVVTSITQEQFDVMVKLGTELRTYSHTEITTLRSEFQQAKAEAVKEEGKKGNARLIYTVAFSILGIFFDALIHGLNLPVPDLAQAAILLLPELVHATVERVKGLAYGWEDLAAVVELSARTPMLESTPAPYGHPGGPGLYHVKGNKHSDYFEQVVQALIRKRGMSKGRASAVAWGAHPEVKDAAARALGQEARARARAHAHARDWDEVGAVISLALEPVKTYQRTVNTKNGPVVQTIMQHQENYKKAPPRAGSGGNQPGKSPWQAQPSQQQEKQRLTATAKQYRQHAAVLGVEEAAFNAALMNALYGPNTTGTQGGATTGAQAGATTAAQVGAKTTATTAATTAAQQAGAAAQVANTGNAAGAAATAPAPVTAAQTGATTAAQTGATTTAQAGATAKTTAPTASATQLAVSAALAAGVPQAQVTKAQQQAVAAAAGMNPTQLRAAITQLQTRITWYNSQAAALTAQAAKLP
jgi:hypothetical protein